MRKKTVLVDMDGVITDWTGRFIQQWSSKFPHEKPLCRENQLVWQMRDWIPGHEDKIRHITREQGFYFDLKPIEGALDALREMLRDTGIHLRICSSPLAFNPYCCDEKQAWLGWNFGDLGIEFQRKLVLTDDKTIVRGDILIDDKPEITGDFTPQWEHVIFDAPYNRNVERPHRRMHNWSLWRQVVYG